jgi:peroxiredoxin
MTTTNVDERVSPLPPRTRAPDFELRSAPDQTVSLAEFQGRPVILVFYPGDWSPVCSDQLALYQAVLPEFQRFNAQLLGISVDGVWSHQAFARDRNLHSPCWPTSSPRARWPGPTASTGPTTARANEPCT